MKKNSAVLAALLVFAMLLSLAACGKSAEDVAAVETAAQAVVDYGVIKGDFSCMTPETAKAYLAVVDELSSHLGYDEADASEGECLHGGFVRDWDSNGTPELCLLLKTSPRESGGWDGTPIYGWYPPTLYLYTCQNGQAVLAGACDLYFGTAGREAAVAALMNGNGIQYIRWERSEITEENSIFCHALINGTLQQTEAPPDAAAASQGAETAQAFLDALGSGKAQLLLYNSSGDARIEGAANARELRSALAAKAA